MDFLEHFDHPSKKQDKEHFNHLIQMALADGKIEDAELKMLHRIGSKMGLTTPEIDNLLEASKNSAYIPPYELSKRFSQLYDIINRIYRAGNSNSSSLVD